MSDRIIALVAVSLSAAILELLLPGEEERGTRLFLRFMTALVTLVLIASPILPWITESETILNGALDWEADDKQAELEAELQQAVSAQSAAQLESWCTALLSERHGLASEQVTVRAKLNASGELEAISVRLSGAGLLRDPNEIVATLLNYFDCEVEVR